MENNILKRDEVKYIRDLAKSSYKKEDCCYICGSSNNLQLHHFNSLTELWERFKRRLKIKIVVLQDMLDYREQFKAAHYKEIYEEVVTLCKYCHMDKLHKIYGKSPPLVTASKQIKWCRIQREKNGLAT